MVLFLLIPAILRSQQQDLHISIPMKNGIVFYEKTYELPSGTSNEKASGLASAWIKKTFPDNSSTILTGSGTRTVIGTGIFKVPVSESGNYFWVKMKVVIAFRESGYTFQLYNYYEKPIEKGISNEYSKIEYRWWDYRQGKPWSPEDKPLFGGIHHQSLQFMQSLEAAIQ